MEEYIKDSIGGTSSYTTAQRLTALESNQEAQLKELEEIKRQSQRQENVVNSLKEVIQEFKIVTVRDQAVAEERGNQMFSTVKDLQRTIEKQDSKMDELLSKHHKDNSDKWTKLVGIVLQVTVGAILGAVFIKIGLK